MSLIPYIFDDFRPRTLRDQLFGLDFAPDDVLEDFVVRPTVSMQKYIRPWRNFTQAVQDVGSNIKCDKDKFQINLDVQHFNPEEISVKTTDGHVVIEGKHEEKRDQHGFVSRQFKRRYTLPENCNPEDVESRLSSDGVLTITAPKAVENKEGRTVPITQTGPVRRKLCDDQLNGEQDQDVTKSPEKKKSRK